jgi:hypothetical protein
LRTSSSGAWQVDDSPVRRADQRRAKKSEMVHEGWRSKVHVPANIFADVEPAADDADDEWFPEYDGSPHGRNDSPPASVRAGRSRNEAPAARTLRCRGPKPPLRWLFAGRIA